MDEFREYLLFKKDIAENQLKIINRYLKGVKTPFKRRTSKTDIVEKILRDAGRPLHVNEIMETAEKRFQISLERDSIVSIISKKIKSDKHFVRTAPNTFDLKRH